LWKLPTKFLNVGWDITLGMDTLSVLTI